MLFITEQRQPPREGVVTSLTKLSLRGCGRASATICIREDKIRLQVGPPKTISKINIPNIQSE